MAVYTEVSFEQADAFVQGLGRGRVSALHGISAGIENTNYFVSSAQGEWVLTLFERLSSEQLPFYLRYMQHLAQHGIPVPEPQADAGGQILHQLCGRPAALVNRLPGQAIVWRSCELRPRRHSVAAVSGRRCTAAWPATTRFG